MFNLLPENLKLKIKAEYAERRIVVILIFVISLLISIIVMLLPTWLSSLYKEMETKKESDKMNQYLATFNVTPTVDLIKSINQKLNILDTLLAYQKIIPNLDIIIAQKTSAIVLTSIAYTSASGDTATISIGGKAVTRDSLVTYVKKLQDTVKFKAVDLPISNLAKDKNISFTMNVTVDVKQHE
jgi:hypothetical protein